MPVAPSAPPIPAPCVVVTAHDIRCARLMGVVGPPDSKTAAFMSGGTYVAPKNSPADVRLIQKLINVIVEANYVPNSILGDGNGKLAKPLAEDGLWDLALHNAIKQIELLYFHGRANPHGIGIIDPQADESLFTFLVGLASGSQQAKQQLSVQMKALAVAMIPSSRLEVDVGGTAPDGTHQSAKIVPVDRYLPILLDALTAKQLNDTDMVLIALACVFTETGNFVPTNEKMYALNTTGTFTDKATHTTWTDTPAYAHEHYKSELQPHANAVLQPNSKYPLRGTETFSPNTLGPNGTTVQGNIYDAYVNSKGKTVNFSGNTNPGDGWKYRGRGLIQLTGRGRYHEADQKAKTGTMFIDNPELVNTDAYAGVVVAGFLSAVEGKLRLALGKNDLTEARRLVNGGDNGLANFKKAIAAGRAVIAQAIIQQAKGVTRTKRSQRSQYGKASPRSPKHFAASSGPLR